jgi:ubiquitin-activating enzyme E1
MNVFFFFFLKQIAACTEKYFPFKIEHTIQWAKNRFLRNFSEIPTDVNLFIDKHNYLAHMIEQNPSPNVQREKLEGLRDKREKKNLMNMCCVVVDLLWLIYWT